MSSFQDQPAVFPGFAMMEMKCALCGHQWIGVAAVGTVGAECPGCGVNERGFVWRGPKPWTAHDGCWLTGAYLLPWWKTEPQRGAEQGRPQEAPTNDVDPYTGEPRNWLKRWLQRLQTAWWALRGEW